jgi:AcrR family transcriptional regulator
VLSVPSSPERALISVASRHDDLAVPPRHAVRATRLAGRERRSQLLDAASELFAERGLGDVSVAEIAEAADAFPSQVTYYFGSKEALFVEAACRGVLRAASEVERAGARARTPKTYVRAIVTTALGAPALPGFIEAMLLARRRPELAPLVQRTLERLHAEGARAVQQTLDRRGWALVTTPDVEARAFWATVLGVVLERAALGEAFDRATAEAAVLLVLNLHPDQLTRPGGDTQDVDERPRPHTRAEVTTD